MGIFVGLKISKENLASIKRFQEEVGLTHPVKEEDIHCTLFASSDNVAYVIKEKDFPIEVTAPRLEKIKTQTGVDCLALFFDSKQLEQKYEDIKESYQAKPFYPDLKLHITLSYDCGNFDIEKVSINDYLKKIDFVSEYVQPLKFEVNRRKKSRD